MVATKTALKLADYVVTEAGFGADLGAEKFFDIKCRRQVWHQMRSCWWRLHGPEDAWRRGQEYLNSGNVAAVKGGLENLGRHLRNIAQYGVPVAVAINRFTADTDAELAAIEKFCSDFALSFRLYSLVRWRCRN
ncbi:MAG: hypothetical protein CM1200mP20_07570 [Pseudomonadota bacterium]|nr:MAG: hypothetical protein CM1200mP20_07570 [Pseudomonadota bacterium]